MFTRQNSFYSANLHDFESVSKRTIGVILKEFAFDCLALSTLVETESDVIFTSFVISNFSEYMTRQQPYGQLCLVYYSIVRPNKTPIIR